MEIKSRKYLFPLQILLIQLMMWKEFEQARDTSISWKGEVNHEMHELLETPIV